MLYGKKDCQLPDDESLIFGSIEEAHDLPKYHLDHRIIPARTAKQMISDEIENEGNARQNLATFCQTYMEPEAVELMAKNLAKNAIDKSEYPRTAEIENRCVNMIANLWHAQDGFMGTSTVGSSEACMLAGISMHRLWQRRAEKYGLDQTKQKPNIVMTSGYQVCWEKFCTYWDIELRSVPMTAEHLSLEINALSDYVDEYTIGIIGVFGITYTGRYDNIEALDKYVEEYNKKTPFKLGIHVDAASGGFYAPFMEPYIKWDFQLKNVISINASGHKYGLVYPSVGWLIWRDRKYIPEDFIFEVNYLGGTMPTMSINFSKTAANIVGQYYNFVRYGMEGYYSIHHRTHKVAEYIIKEICKNDDFEVINGADHLPVLCYTLKNDDKRKWNLYDLSDRLRMYGWQVPTYPLPKGRHGRYNCSTYRLSS